MRAVEASGFTACCSRKGLKATLSIQPRSRRTAKTDMIDGKTLLRALLAYQIPWGMDTDQFRGQTEVVIRSLWR